MTRVVVIDPQPAVRAGLAMLLRTEPGLVPVGSAVGARDVVVKRPEVSVKTTEDTLRVPTVTTRTDTVNTPVVGTQTETLIVKKPVVGTKKTEVKVPVVKKP